MMTAELAVCSIVKLQNQAKQTLLISCPPISNSNELLTLSASARLALRIPVACNEHALPLHSLHVAQPP